MIKILIVDDSTEKLGLISQSISTRHGFEFVDIDTAVDIHSARSATRAKQYDLLIVDLFLPDRVGNDPQIDGGLKLIDEIDRDRRLFPPFHILAITADSEALDHNRINVQDRLWGIIYFSAAEDSWKNKIAQKVQYLIESKKSAERSEPRGHLVDVAILTALSEELSAVKDLPVHWAEERVVGDPTIYFRGAFTRGDRTVSVVAAAAGRMGMAATATLATKVQSAFRPKYIAMAGIAAGVKGRTKIGDVLIADPSWDWGSGKFEVVDGKGRFSLEPLQLRLDAGVRGRLKDAIMQPTWLQAIRLGYPGDRPAHDLSAHVESVASGASVVADRAVLEQIGSSTRKLYGVEMEIFGLMAAVQDAVSPRPIAFSAKSVCDFGDEEKSDAHRRYANYVSARFLHEFILDHLYADLLVS